MFNTTVGAGAVGAKRREILFFTFEAKNLNRNKAKTSLFLSPLFSLEQAKTKRKVSRFASFCFEAKKKFKRNRRTLTGTKG
jgi:hypothetical protein